MFMTQNKLSVPLKVSSATIDKLTDGWNDSCIYTDYLEW